MYGSVTVCAGLFWIVSVLCNRKRKLAKNKPLQKWKRLFTALNSCFFLLFLQRIKTKIYLLSFPNASQKERDLELAARIGQSLLKKNKSLTERNEFLEEQVEHIREEVCFFFLHLTDVSAVMGRNFFLVFPLSLLNFPVHPICSWSTCIVAVQSAIFIASILLDQKSHLTHWVKSDGWGKKTPKTLKLTYILIYNLLI